MRLNKSNVKTKNQHFTFKINSKNILHYRNKCNFRLHYIVEFFITLLMIHNALSTNLSRSEK